MKTPSNLGLLAAACLLLSACGTPAIRSTVPLAQLQESKRVVVISAVGDKIEYHKQGFVASDHSELVVANWGLDMLITSKAAAALNTLPGVEAVEYRGSVANFAALYSGIPGNGGLAFGEIRAPLERIFNETGAGAAVLVFRGGAQLPGANRYFVQGLVVTQVRGAGCGAFPFTLIAIVDRKTLLPVATNRLAADSASAPWVPDQICEAQLRNLTTAQTEALKQSFLARMGVDNIHESIARLFTAGSRP